MRKITLTSEQKTALEAQHRVERDRRRVADRIKAVLLHSEGWTQQQISQALRIRPETVSGHPADYEAEKLQLENGGSVMYNLQSQAGPSYHPPQGTCLVWRWSASDDGNKNKLRLDKTQHR